MANNFPTRSDKKINLSSHRIILKFVHFIFYTNQSIQLILTDFPSHRPFFLKHKNVPQDNVRNISRKYHTLNTRLKFITLCFTTQIA